MQACVRLESDLRAHDVNGTMQHGRCALRAFRQTMRCPCSPCSPRGASSHATGSPCAMHRAITCSRAATPATATVYPSSAGSSLLPMTRRSSSSDTCLGFGWKEKRGDLGQGTGSGAEPNGPQVFESDWGPCGVGRPGHLLYTAAVGSPALGGGILGGHGCVLIDQDSRHAPGRAGRQILDQAGGRERRRGGDRRVG